MSNSYTVTIKGVQKGKDIDDVLKILSTLFKSNPDKLRPLLLSGNLVAKKSVGIEAAEKYQKAITNAGCVVEIEEELEFEDMPEPLVESKHPADTKYCSSCGHKNISNARFCESCGISLEANIVSQKYRNQQIDEHSPSAKQKQVSSIVVKEVKANGSNKKIPKFIGIPLNIVLYGFLLSFFLIGIPAYQDYNKKADAAKRAVERASQKMVQTSKYTYGNIGELPEEIAYNLWDVAVEYPNALYICHPISITAPDGYGNNKVIGEGTIVLQGENLIELRKFRDKKWILSSVGFPIRGKIGILAGPIINGGNGTPCPEGN